MNYRVTDASHRPRRRRLAGVLVAGAVAAGIAGCGGGSTVNKSSSSSSGSGSSGTAAANTDSTAGASGKNDWVIGSLIDLTGSDAAGGAAQQKGIAYSLKQINASGGIDGRKVTVKFCDTQSTPSGAAQCAQQLASVNSHIVLGQSIDPPTRGALPYLTHDLVVSVDPILLPKSNTTVFQASGAPGPLLAVMVKAIKAAGYRTMGVLYTTDTSGTHQLAAAKAAAAQGGIKVVAEPQTPGTNDVTPELVKLRSAGADAIYLASIGTNTAAAVTSYKTLGTTEPIIAGAGAVTNGFLHSLSSIPQHLYGDSQLLVTNTGLPARTVKAFQAYLTQFKSEEGEPADTQTTTAIYDGCVALAALKGTGSSDVAAMSKYLKSHTINCLGSAMRFNLPGLNVINDQPSSLAQAPASANAGWGPVKGKL